jgi:alkanesulfonate monooxygenase SsuD/methylene tetrahydromethanopterin reductase-like flavin-dependent oxidoreductase (luciferase family)
MEEQIQVLRELWEKPIASYHGEFHDFEPIAFGPKPVQRPSPPIWIANNPQIFPLDSRIVERMLRRVARLCDGWQTCLATPDEFRTMLEKVREYEAEAGREPGTVEPSYQVLINVHPDRKTARSEALDFINRYYVTDFPSIEASMWDRDPFGTPDECIERLAGIIEAGCQSFSFRFASPHQQEQVERFTEEVLPALQRVAAPAATS